jgi:hypothetical protein
MNAPYGEPSKWAMKAVEAMRGGAIVVGLFANNSSSIWYRDYIVPHALVVQLGTRLKFKRGGKRHSQNAAFAPFPSILAIWPREAGSQLMPHCTPIPTALLQMPE